MAYKILLADDDVMNVEMMSLVLTKGGGPVCIVDQAYDGYESWAKICIDTPDLVLLDWEMPGISGIEVLQRMKSDYRLRDIPVIIVTGKTSSENLSIALESGATDYIKKPIDKIELLARVRAALNLFDTIRDVKTKNKRIESQIDDLNRLSLIVKQTDNSVLIFNTDGTLEWGNEGFHKMYGYSLEEFKQHYGTDIYSLSYLPNIREKLAELFEKKHSVNYITKCRVKYGAVKWIQTTLTPVFDGDTIEKYIAIETDISQQKRVEMELVKRNEETRELMRNVQVANELLEKQKKEILKQNTIIEQERKKTDDLLLNILPQYVVSQLKNIGYATPRKYKMATVMFTDFKGFTKSCENLTQDQIVAALDYFFTKFDDIVANHYIEKIKTIGDSYMCVGGIPLRNRSNPIDVVLAGLEINRFMRDYKKNKSDIFLPDWQLRIGVHTGPLIAGVVGKIKFAYDTWGDSVNIAKRMESADLVGSVNVSESTYNYIKDYFLCERRGPAQIKNHSDIDMYFVYRLKPEYSKDEDGIYPNDFFANTLNNL